MPVPPLTGNWTDVIVGLDPDGNPIVPDPSNRRRAHASDINDLAHSVIALEARPPGSTAFALNAKDYGCACNLSTNDTAPLSALLTSSAGRNPVIIPYPGCKVTNLSIPPKTWLMGEYVPNADSGIAGSQLLGGSGSQPVISLMRTATIWTALGGVYPFQQSRIEDLVINGGLDSIDGMNGCIDTYFRNLSLYPSRDGFHFSEFVQGNVFENCEVVSGRDGYHLELSARNSPNSTIMDKNRFIGPYFHGQSRNAYRVQVYTSFTNTIYNPRFIFCANDGMYLEGGINGLTIVEATFESIGFTGVNSFVPQLGSIGATTGTLTVADSSKFSLGNTVTVKGAGGTPALGADFIAVVGTIPDASHLLLNIPASVTVTNVEVTTGAYSEIVLRAQPTSGGIPSDIIFIGGQLGAQGNTTSLRYSIDNPVGSHVTSINTLFGLRPVYDISGGVVAINGSYQSGSIPDTLRRLSTTGITGAKGGNAALGSIMTYLVNTLGVSDRTTA